MQIPDLDGDLDGSNPLHLWPEACAYGIGSGLFEGSSEAAANGRATTTLYTVLEVPTWATKSERRYQELKRGKKVRDRDRWQATVLYFYLHIYMYIYIYYKTFLFDTLCFNAETRNALHHFAKDFALCKRFSVSPKMRGPAAVHTKPFFFASHSQASGRE